MASKKVTVRIEEEAYKKLKEYAEAHEESMGDVVSKAVVSYVKKGAAPKQGPAPKPQPAKEHLEIPGEILGLPGRMRKLEERAAQVDGTVEGLRMSVERLQRQVSTFLSAYETMLPVRPQGQWSPFVGRGVFGELADPEKGGGK